MTASKIPEPLGFNSAPIDRYSAKLGEILQLPRRYPKNSSVPGPVESNQNKLGFFIPAPVNVKSKSTKKRYRIRLYLLASRSLQGFAFQVRGGIVKVLADVLYWAHTPRRGSTQLFHGKATFEPPRSKYVSTLDYYMNYVQTVSNDVYMYFDIPKDAEFHPVGWKRKTAPRYKKRHITILPMPLLKGFGTALERKSGGTQEVRQVFATPATLRMILGAYAFKLKTAFFWINTVDKIKLSDSYSFGSAVGFTTDLINSKDEPTHWGVVINGESLPPLQPEGPQH